jgi:hypothetical protein
VHNKQWAVYSGQFKVVSGRKTVDNKQEAESSE